VTRGAKVAWPFDLTAEEESLGLSGMWRKYIGAAIDELGDVTAPGWPPAGLLEKFDRISGTELLAARGASPGAIALLSLGYPDLSGDGLETNSALLVLRDSALRRTEKKTLSIRGGNDRLPRALAAALARRILYEAPAVRIEPGEMSASVVARRRGSHQRFTADHVVCAVPFSVLRTLEVSPPFSATKRAAIAQLPYTSVARVFLQSRRRFWDEDGLPNSATTDLPIKWIWEPTANQPGPRGILESYTAGADARRVIAMSESERIRFVLDEMQKVFPAIRDHFEVGASKSWDDDRWARGGYAWFRPGQMTALLPHIERSEGRVHFAGEHASAWPQWMQGALASGVRTAREVVEASRRGA
jgi:monoamine oxidase